MLQIFKLRAEKFRVNLEFNATKSGRDAFYLRLGHEDCFYFSIKFTVFTLLLLLKVKYEWI